MEVSEYQPKNENITKLDFGSYSIAEYPNQPNEDNLFYLKNAAFIFDGMGGRTNGEKASQIACDYLKSSISGVDYEDISSLHHLKAYVEQKVNAANYLVYTSGKEDGSGGATTITAAFFRKSEKGEPYVLFANVGDSRGYILRDGFLFQQTDDDNEVWGVYGDRKRERQVQIHINNAKRPEDLNEEERQFFKRRNLITQALGNAHIKVSFNNAVLKEGDRIILCTDGVFDNLTTEEMEKAVRGRGSSQELAQNLVNAAHKRSREGKEISFRSKKDDISAIVITPIIGMTDRRSGFLPFIKRK